jgi:ESS family glutamate:Na+ symporter
MTAIQIPGLLTFTIAIVVFFAGSGINRAVPALQRWNIPEAVTGGLIAATLTLVAYEVFGREISFTLAARDMLLLYFFTGIGLNAKIDDLLKGGRPLAILLGITIVFLVIQNVIAVTFSGLLGLPEGLAPLVGSAALIGGHGTTIAWAPTIEARFGLDGALEAGIASATLGLVVASLLGGPVAGYLIRRFGLKGSSDAGGPMVGLPQAEERSTKQDDISHINLMRTILVLNLVILAAYALEETVERLGVKLPLFVVCMVLSILATNIVPRLAPRLAWPSRTRSLALLSDLSLNIFLAMSLMSMQLWTLEELGPRLLVVLAVQTAAAAIYMIFVVFPSMGRDYFAAVIAAGFAGISLGATPTGIANMTAVTKLHGPAARAFIILPLVSAFFIDIANAIAIGFMIR